VDDAERFHAALPGTLALLEQGELYCHQARTLLHRTRHCPVEVARAVEAELLPDVVGLCPSDLGKRFDRAVLQIESEQATPQAEQRHADAAARPAIIIVGAPHVRWSWPWSRRFPPRAPRAWPRASRVAPGLRHDPATQYAKNAFPTLEVYGDLDHAGLRLIIRGGSSDSSTGHYRDSIDVFATWYVPRSRSRLASRLLQHSAPTSSHHSYGSTMAGETVPAGAGTASPRTAIITGGASGIGAALAAALVAEGADVVLADIDEPGVLGQAAELDARGPGSAQGHVLDVRDAAAVTELVQDVKRTRGRLDLMFNNAGIALAGEPDELSPEQWERTLDVNLRGVLHGCLAAFPVMREQGRGHLVNTASIAGLLPCPGPMAAYATSKSAVVGLSLSLRAAGADLGVRVSALCPGWTDTPLLDGVARAAVDVGAAPRSAG
jgi:NAD(P)-dependent dehydrogenase (short-subunit alcohol dehydrogenase family)